MDKTIIYWYANDKGIHSTYSKPNHDHVMQITSSIGIPGMRAIQYNYNNKTFNKILSITEVDSPSIIYNILNGDDIK